MYMNDCIYPLYLMSVSIRIAFYLKRIEKKEIVEAYIGKLKVEATQLFFYSVFLYLCVGRLFGHLGFIRMRIGNREILGSL